MHMRGGAGAEREVGSHHGIATGAKASAHNDRDLGDLQTERGGSTVWRRTQQLVGCFQLLGLGPTHQHTAPIIPVLVPPTCTHATAPIIPVLVPPTCTHTTAPIIPVLAPPTCTHATAPIMQALALVAPGALDRPVLWKKTMGTPLFPHSSIKCVPCKKPIPAHHTNSPPLPHIPHILHSPSLL